jgi:hypothetical protein
VRAVLVPLAFGSMMVASAPASAAVLEVPGDHPSIQAAVNAADPGDDIEVSKKKNPENVTVATENISIAGVGKGVIVNAALGGGSYGFNITSPQVLVKNLTVRHGEGIHCAANRCSVSAVRFDGLGGNECIEIDGNAARVSDSVLAACESDGVNVNGDGASVRDNRITAINSHCVVVAGDDAIVSRNAIRGCEGDDGIQVFGDDVTIEDNSVKAAGDGIRVFGDGASISENVVDDARGFCVEVSGAGNVARGNSTSHCGLGVRVSGQNPRVSANRVFHHAGFGQDAALHVQCAVACDQGIASKNRVEGANGNSDAFDFSVSAPGFRVIGNVAERNAGLGFDLSLTDGVVRGNTATRNGFEHEEGFRLSGGGGILFEENRAIANYGHGIAVVGGTGHEVRGNLARGNYGDGIDVQGFPAEETVVVGNQALSNLGDGIENFGAGTEFRGNEAGGNLVDCANTPPGTIAVNQDNACADGSNFAVPGAVSSR